MDLKEIIEVIRGTVRNSSSRIAACAEARVSCEGWLKVELLYAFALKFKDRDDVEILPEKQHIDLVLLDRQEKILIELKTFPSNYGASGKPITNFIGGLIQDLEKLCPLGVKGTKCLAVWIAYPIPDTIPASWPRHLSRVRGVASVTHCVDVIPLWPGQNAHLHIMEPLVANVIMASQNLPNPY
jgi:hypothetical protein